MVLSSSAFTARFLMPLARFTSPSSTSPPSSLNSASARSRMLRGGIVVIAGYFHTEPEMKGENLAMMWEVQKYEDC